MYDFIYLKIEKVCLIPHLLQKTLLEENYELTSIKLTYK